MPHLIGNAARYVKFPLSLILLLASLASLLVFYHRSSSTQVLLTSAAEAVEHTGFQSQTGETDREARESVSEAYGKLPLSFEANHGQTDPRVKFVSRGSGYGLFLTSTEAVLRLQSADFALRNKKHIASSSNSDNPQSAVLRMTMAGANPAPTAEGQDELPGKSNYFIGNDPQKWQRDVPNFKRVRYTSVYPGVDVVYYGNQRQLEYDFIVSPGADPRQIRLAFDGARRMRIDERGDLILGTTGGEVRQHRPIVYQEEQDGRRREVAGSYVRRGRYEVGFEVGDYDATKALVIDPVLVYSTYLGSTGSDSGYGIAVDSDGNAYVTGFAGSVNFPVTAGAFQTSGALLQGTSIYYGDAFVTKLNQTGSALVYSTYLGGGRGGDVGLGIAVDRDGNAYVTGNTSCSPCVNDGGNDDFPTVNAFQSTFGGTDDAFITKLNPTGSALIFSTYLGGRSSDNGARIVVNPTTGDSYVVGSTGSGNFPTTPGAYKSSLCPGAPYCSYSGADAWDAKFSATGTLQWSTLIGSGSANDVALDASGNTYITGSPGSNFPTTPGAYQTVRNGAVVFVTKMNPTGTALVYSTLFGGGTQSIRSWGIEIDESGNAYITGQTQQAAMPTTPGAFDQSFNGGEDAYVTKFNATGSALLYSTFFGGSSEDVGRSIAIDGGGNAYVTGETKSGNFPYVNSLQDPIGTPAIYLLKLNSTGSALVFSTNLGTEEGRDVAVDSAGNAYLTGTASSIPFTPGAFQTARNGNQDDAFVMKIGPANESAQTFSIEGRVFDQNQGGPHAYDPVTVTLTGAQNRGMTILSGGSFKFSQLPAGGTYTVTVTKAGFAVQPQSETLTNLGANQTVNFTILVNNQSTAQITSPQDGATFTSPGPITVTANASDSDGTISRVIFEAYSGATSGVVFTESDATPPYSVTMNNIPAGALNLYATPVDNLGLRGQYDLVQVNVTCGSVPTVSLTAPADGATYRAGEFFNVSANATGACGAGVSYVDFFNGTDLIGRDSSAPYKIEWRSITTGTFTLTAKAVSGSNTSNPSNAATVTIVEANPRIYGRVANGNGVGVGTVTMTLSGTRSATTTTNANGDYSFTNLNLPWDGSYTITPSKDGYLFDPPSKSISYLGFYDYKVDFDADLITPVTAQLTSPVGYGLTYTIPANINIQAEASSTAGAITKVDFYANQLDVGTIFIGTDTVPPYSIDWNNVQQEGYYYLYVIATDAGGATGQSNFQEIQIISDEPETVRIVGQVTNNFGAALQNIEVTLNDGTQTFTSDTNLNGYYGFFNLTPGRNYTVTPTSPYTFTPSSYTFNNLRHDEIDVDFTTSQSNTPPTVTMTSPSNGTTFTMPVDITLSANASDNDEVIRVGFYADRVEDGASIFIGSDTLPPYSLVWGPGTPGTYNVHAVAFDNGGLSTTSAPVTITVNPPPPVTISGRVVDRNSVGIPAVLMTLSGGQSATTLTDDNGFYAFTNLPTFNTYTVTPSSLFYTIVPSSRTYTNLTTSVRADFTATLVLQPSDFDGDGITDVAVYRPSTGVWYVTRTSDGVIISQQLGSQSHGDIACPGNYDGDLSTDFAVWRPSDGTWRIRESSTGTIRVQQWGMQGDKPVAGDYDGDGKTDLAVFRPSSSMWYILKSSTNSMQATPWGLSTDVAAPGDYDGDGKTDLAVFRPSNGIWYILQSTSGNMKATQWGLSTDVAVAGDYDGDNKMDIAVFRPNGGVWYILLSTTNTMRAQQWGLSTDKPVPGDYDLDGQTDVAVFRPSNGLWYVLKSTDGGMQAQSWGMEGDVPVPFAYLPQ